MWYVFVIPFIIFFIVFLVIVKNFFRAHKHTGDTMEDMITTISAYAEKQMEDTMKEIDNSSREQTKTCEYCGSTISAGSSQCDSCGAKVKK